MAAEPIPLRSPSPEEADRLGAFVELCAAMAAGDFSHRAPVAGDGSLLDGIATGLNLVADELCERSAREADYQRRMLHGARLAAVGQLAAGVAHEVNNPAAVLLANLTALGDHVRVLEALVERLREALPPGATRELLERELARAETDARLRDLREIGEDGVAGARRIAAMVRSLLDFSGIGPDDVAETRLDEVAGEACKLVAREIAARATLVTALAPVPPVAADRRKLVQVATNLLLNAAQALEDDPAARHRIEIATAAGGGFVVLRVSDDGPGMDAAVRAHLFEPFFTTRPRGRGTGLGLAVSAEIVRAHGGEIRVESGPGLGARFEVRLPLRTALAARAPDAAAPPPEAAGPAPAPAPARRPRVLVVDDEPTLLAAYRRMLGADHDVEVAPGGREAIARLDRDPTFDAIVCDLFMPGAGGGEVLAHLERHHPALCRRFVLSSAGAYTPGAAALAASLGDRFVGKPLEYGALRALVRRLAEG